MNATCEHLSEKVRVLVENHNGSIEWCSSCGSVRKIHHPRVSEFLRKEHEPNPPWIAPGENVSLDEPDKETPA